MSSPMPAPRAALSAPSPTPTAAWIRRKERSHLWALRLMRWIALKLGRRVSRIVLHPITLYFLLTDGSARRQSQRYLGRVLGRPVGWADAYRHLHHFAATVLDRVYFLQDRHDQFDIRTTDIDLMDERLARGEGGFLVGAHFGSFEAMRAAGDWHGQPVAMVMYEENARLINAALAAIAPQARLHTIALGRLESMLTLRHWLDAGGVAGLLADRALPGPSGRSRTMRLPFLGQPARFFDGPFRLAAMLRRPVVFMAGLYHGGNRYELRFISLADFSERPAGGAAAMEQTIQAALQRYVELLESLCRESPLNWFNFFDFWADDADSISPALSEGRPPAGADAPG